MDIRLDIRLDIKNHVSRYDLDPHKVCKKINEPPVFRSEDPHKRAHKVDLKNLVIYCFSTQ